MKIVEYNIIQIHNTSYFRENSISGVHPLTMDVLNGKILLLFVYFPAYRVYRLLTPAWFN